MDWLYKIAIGALVVIAVTFAISFKEGSSENDEFKSLMSNYMDAFNQRNADKLASLWAENAVYVDLTSRESMQGRDAIRDYFKEQFENTEEETLKITITESTVKEPGKATIKGAAEVTSEGETEKSIFVADLTKENDSWLLQKVLEVDIQPFPSHYEELKDLEWLVGKWSGENDNAKITSNVTWDKYKNFLTATFEVVVLEQVIFQGHQVIGWDPEKKKIRSWVFDSDGGFAEAFWTKQGNHWYVNSVSIIPDGRKGSATNIYTKIDDNTFTFASEDREVGGKFLPNVKPLQIHKMQ